MGGRQPVQARQAHDDAVHARASHQDNHRSRPWKSSPPSTNWPRCSACDGRGNCRPGGRTRCSPHRHECHGSVRKPQVVTQEAFRELSHPDKKHVPPVFLSQTPSDQRGRRGTEERPSSSRISSRPTVRSGAATAKVFREAQDDVVFLLEECTLLLHLHHKYKIAPKSARIVSNGVDTRGNLVCVKVDTGWARSSSGYEGEFEVSVSETIKFHGSEQRISYCESAVLTPVSDLGP